MELCRSDRVEGISAVRLRCDPVRRKGHRVFARHPLEQRGVASAVLCVHYTLHFLEGGIPRRIEDASMMEKEGGAGIGCHSGPPRRICEDSGDLFSLLEAPSRMGKIKRNTRRIFGHSKK